MYKQSFEQLVTIKKLKDLCTENNLVYVCSLLYLLELKNTIYNHE